MIRLPPPAAREAQAAEVRIADHRGTDVTETDDHVEDAGRQLRGVRGFGVALAREWRDVARLDDDRVAASSAGTTWGDRDEAES